MLSAMGIRRKLNRKAIAHANADSSTHQRHVFERKQKRAVTWIPVASDRSDASIFGLSANDLKLPNGYYYIGTTASESAVDGPQFEKALNVINQERCWHYAKMERYGDSSTVKRRLRGSAVNEMVINLSPWQMTFINREQARWEEIGATPDERKRLLLALLGDLRREVMAEFETNSGIVPVGSYIHLDSNKIHFGVTFSRVDANNQLLSKDRLRTIGPWSVAQSRIVGIGGGDPGDLRLKQNLDRFSERYGPGQVPLDLRLHMAVDRGFDSLVQSSGSGAPERFEGAKADYLQWKREARSQHVGYTSADLMKFGWLLLRVISPVLPKPICQAISTAKSAIQAMHLVLKLAEGFSGQSLSARREIQPFLSL